MCQVVQDQCFCTSCSFWPVTLPTLLPLTNPYLTLKIQPKGHLPGHPVLSSIRVLASWTVMPFFSLDSKSWGLCALFTAVSQSPSVRADARKYITWSINVSSMNEWMDEQTAVITSWLVFLPSLFQEIHSVNCNQISSLRVLSFPCASQTALVTALRQLTLAVRTTHKMASI